MVDNEKVANASMLEAKTVRISPTASAPIICDAPSGMEGPRAAAKWATSTALMP
jgi:hypothetical protein